MIHEHDESLAEPDQAVTGLTVTDHIDQLDQSLQAVCSKADPLFISVGRELRAISGEAGSLSDAIHGVVGRVQGDSGINFTLSRTGELVQGVLTRLTQGHQEIHGKLDKIHELVDQFLNFRKVSDTIEKIAELFRVVRINILIQCSSRSISEDVFNEVSDDITSLVENISDMTRKIQRDLKTVEKDHKSLDSAVSKNLVQVGKMAESAEAIVNQTFGDIERLLASESEMIERADGHSDDVRRLVGEVVVDIQFHDSMSQRIEHIIDAFADIRQLLTSPGQKDLAGTLGTAYIIFDLQQRQIEQLLSEISSIRASIETSFQTIGVEVQALTSVLLGSRFVASSRTGGGNVFLPLKKGLLDLHTLIGQEETIIDEMNLTAARTAGVVNRLFHLMDEIRDMHKQTRLRAFNTIIMANHLGEKGRTIEVLAGEMRSLSDQTSDLCDDVTAIQQSMSATIAFFDSSGQTEHAGRGSTELEQGVEDIGDVYQQIEQLVSTVAARSEVLDDRIAEVSVSLSFLDDLKDGLSEVNGQMREVLTELHPWRNSASRDSQEFAQLIQRYTMEQERMIHLFSHDEKQEDIALETSEGEEDDIGQNVEFF